MSDLIPESARAMVGRTTAEPVTAVITAKESQRYAQAVDDLNPLYFDEEAARAAGYRTIICPPTFLDHVVVQGRPLSELREDGTVRARASGAGTGLKRVMFGGQEWDWVAPVHVGDEITATQRLASIEEKHGRKGPFVLTTMETTFTNQAGDVVARSRLQGIAR